MATNPQNSSTDAEDFDAAMEQARSSALLGRIADRLVADQVEEALGHLLWAKKSLEKGRYDDTAERLSAAIDQLLKFDADPLKQRG